MTIHVGDTVRLKHDRYIVLGIVIEDRGEIGAHGRQLYRVRVETDPELSSEIEVPAEELQRISGTDAQDPLNQQEIIDYLVQGGLVSILRSNSGGRPPRIWLRRDGLCNVTHTFTKEYGLVGGQTPPFDALYHGKVFEREVDNVVSFLESFGLSQDEAKEVINHVGIAP